MNFFQILSTLETHSASGRLPPEPDGKTVMQDHGLIILRNSTLWLCIGPNLALAHYCHICNRIPMGNGHLCSMCEFKYINIDSSVCAGSRREAQKLATKNTTTAGVGCNFTSQSCWLLVSSIVLPAYCFSPKGIYGRL